MEDRLSEIIASSFAAGYRRCRKDFSPNRDVMSKSEAKRYLAYQGFRNPERIINNWVEQGKLRIHKREGRNCKATLSSCELERCILESQTRDFVARIV
jgi:hypothetical protein